MLKIITKVLLVALTLLVVSELIPGIDVAGIYPAIIASIILGVLNVLVKPFLIIITFPITILTLGLFILVINASLFWFAASFIDGFTTESVVATVFASLVVSLVSSLGNRFI